MKYCLISVLISLFLFSCSDRKYEGYCICNGQYILDISNGEYVELGSRFKPHFEKYTTNFMTDNNILTGYSDKTFIRYSIKENKVEQQCKLGKNSDDIIYSGFSEQTNNIYYCKNNIVIEKNLYAEKEKIIFNLNDEFNLCGKGIERIYYNEEAREIYIILEIEVEKHRYEYKLYKLDIQNSEIVLLAQRYGRRIQIYYNYSFNHFYYSYDENIYMISDNKSKKLKIKNNSIMNSDLSIASIDENTIIYRNAKFNIALYLFGSEAYELLIYDLLNNKIIKMKYSDRFP